MKKLKVILLSLSALFIILVQSCDSCDCPTPEPPMISHYNLNKSIVGVNTSNVSTGFETVFSQSIIDSTNRAKFSQSFVKAGRFYDDESGYFFIETLPDAWVVAHVNEDLIGTSRIDVQDENGTYFIQNIVKTVTYSGFGFVEYYRKNPSTLVNERKLSFVTSIKSANWFIGTGFYGEEVDVYYSTFDANAEILQESTRTMANGIGGILKDIYTVENDQIQFCRDFVDNISFFDDGSGYFFINTLEGINVAHGANPDLQGQDVSELQDIKGAYITQDMIDIVKTDGSGFYEYYWINPSSGEEQQKLSYVMLIPGTNYYVGAGFYF